MSPSAQAIRSIHRLQHVQDGNSKPEAMPHGTDCLTVDYHVKTGITVFYRERVPLQ